MATATTSLPLSETLEPRTAAEVASHVTDCFTNDVAVYPIGGGTSLDTGLAGKKPGVGLALTGLNRVLDYPARDLTISVEAGITMQALAEVLAGEQQQLPIDVPRAAEATLGGVIATNFNGPRRFGHGTVRDYVIGIHAVDGRGTPFKGGGRVVKNVAGYDFCKLLTGSYGTLGVITHVTLKLKPIAEARAVMVCAPRTLAEAELLLAGLGQSRTTPVAVELLVGDAWDSIPLFDSNKAWFGNHTTMYLVVGLEGSEAEVGWMTSQLAQEWWELKAPPHQTWLDADARDLFDRLVEFPASGSPPMCLKASVVPSRVTDMIAAAKELDPNCTIQAHAGNGIVLMHLSQPIAGGVTRGLIGKLQTAAVAARGGIVVLSSAGGMEATHQSVWGTLSAPTALLNSIKREFDPKNILNPDRFVF